jgi:nicotinamidase/pyrazinamidase
MGIPAAMDCRLQPGDALLVADVQNDFLPGGALGIRGGDEIVAPLNRWMARFSQAGLPVFVTRDWHPSDHCSFHAQGGLWPPHCVAGTAGAEFAPALALPAATRLIAKATRPESEAYSAFMGTDLDTQLRDARVQRLFVGGLATDYCVLNTVRDALQLGYGVMLLRDAVRAVDVRPGDGTRAIDAMLAAGAVAVRGADDA